MTESGTEIQDVGIGTWKYHGEDCRESIYNALVTGYRHIDCAFAYGNQDYVGKAIKGFLAETPNISRSELFITSKLWNSQHGDVEKACRSCIDELGTEYLDLYLIHWPICFFPNEESTDWSAVKKSKQSLTDAKYPKDKETGLLREKEFSIAHLTNLWKEMESLVKKGLVKRIGVSNFNIGLLEQLLKIANIKPYCNQIECHPYLKQEEIRTYMSKEGIKFVSFSPLGGGNTNLMENKAIKAAAETLGCSTCQFILAWNIAQGNVVIPRSKTLEYLKENFECQKYVEKIKNDDSLLNIELGDEIRTCVPLANTKEETVERNKNFDF